MGSLNTFPVGSAVMPRVQPLSSSASASTREQREIRFDVRELRVLEESGKKYFSGYAAVFNSVSNDLGGWREIIRPGAFDKTLASGREIRNLVNHNSAQILGSTAAGTTELWVDEHGLAFRTLCSDRTYEQDLIKSLERGDASRCSFAFSVRDKKVGQRWTRPSGVDYELRELLDVELYEVSILTADPAYSATSAEVVMRSMFPDGVPVELRDRMQAVTEAVEEEVISAENAENVDANSACACACESCVAGNCENCTNTACVDPSCDCSQNGKEDAEEAAEGEDMSAETVVSWTVQAVDVPVVNASGTVTASSTPAPHIPVPRLHERRSVHANFRRIRAKVQSRMADRDARASRESRGMEFRAKTTEEKVLVLYLYGDIGEDYCGDGISTGTIRRAIENAGDFTSIQLRINSPGGDAFEGVAIGNYLRSLGKPIVSCVDGLAASAASVIALCAHRVQLAPNAMLMCHNASTGAYGFASDLRKVADVLEKISNSIAQTYVRKTGKSLEEIQTLLESETWLGADEAVAEGFADAVVDPGDDPEDSMPVESKALAMLHESRLLTGGVYRNVPETFIVFVAASDIEVRTLLAARAAGTEVETRDAAPDVLVAAVEASVEASTPVTQPEAPAVDLTALDEQLRLRARAAVATSSV